MEFVETTSSLSRDSRLRCDRLGNISLTLICARRGYVHIRDDQYIESRFTLRQNGRYVLKHFSSSVAANALYILPPVNEEEACVLCFDASPDTTLTCCGHSLCKKCLFNNCLINKKNCPFCREPITIPTLLREEYYDALELQFRDTKRLLRRSEQRNLATGDLTRQFEAILKAWNELYSMTESESSPENLQVHFIELDSHLTSIIPALTGGA